MFDASRTKHKHWRGVPAIFGREAAPVLGFCLLMLGAPIAFADAPLQPPHAHRICANSGDICVALEPGKDGRVEQRDSSGVWRHRWTVSGWHRWGWLADNGEYFISCGSQSLVPLEAFKDIPVARVYAARGLLREVKLSEVLVSTKHLKRTVSHWYWGTCDGFAPDEKAFLITTVSGRYLLPLDSLLLEKIR